MPGHYGGPSISSGSKTKTKTKTKTSSTPSGAVGFRPPSSAPSGPEIATTTANVIKKLENQKKERAKKLREELDNIVDKKGTEGFETAPGIVAIPTMGKRTGKFKDIEDKLRKGEKLTGAEQVIADFYLSSAVNPYAANIQKFKERPGGLEVFKEKFPNPLVKAARGLGKFFEEGTFLGKILSSLNPSDKKKAEIIVDESRRQPYNVDEGIMNYMDKIRRDQMLKNKREGITYDPPDMLGITTPRLTGITDANKRQIVESFTGQSTEGMDQNTVNKAYNQIQKLFAERRAIASETANKRAMDDFTNFQNINEQVVDEATGTGDPGDQLRFELGGGDLSGSVSETDYSGGGMEGNQAMADLDQMGLAVPGPVFPNQFDIITESGNPAYSDVRGQDYNALMNEFNNAEQKNMGGYMGMSTFDKLKMIADGIADNK